MTKNEELLKLMHKLSVMGRRTPPPRPINELKDSYDERPDPPRPVEGRPPRPVEGRPPRPEEGRPPRPEEGRPPHPEHRELSRSEHFMPPMPPRHPEPPMPPMPPRRATRILPVLNEEGAMSQKDLAEKIGIRPQSLSEAIRRLEADGLVKREENEEDKRQTLVSLTEEGKKKITELSESRQRYAEQFFSVLSDEEKETLYTLLKKLTDSWEKAF